MKAQIHESGVPFVITYRKVIRRPKLARERKFVGVLRLMKNALVKAIETVEDMAFETKTEVLDPGQSVAVHWAIDVEDPFDTTTGREKSLIAYRILGDNRPTSGAHFEIFSMPPKSQEEEKEEETVEEQEGSEEPDELTPEQWAVASRSRRIRAAAQNGNGSHNQARPRQRQHDLLTAPVIDSAYEPRKVRTLEEELAEDGVTSEESEGVDGAGSIGEDD